jgi:hypothetical protein
MATATAVAIAAADPIPDCPACSDRGEVVQVRSGNAMFGKKGYDFADPKGDPTLLRQPVRGFIEGRDLRLEADAHPRAPARLVAAPRIERNTAGGRELVFTLDAPDDVLVEIVDGAGQPLRTLACGVLGRRAPPPLIPDHLDQRLQLPDLPAGASVRVSVGCQPRFQGSIGHDPAQLTDYLMGLSVDGQGRIYAVLHTPNRTDPSVLRFRRDGTFADMVYPSDPAQLLASGRTLSEVYEPVERIDGRIIPLRHSNWRSWILRWDEFIPWPGGMAPDGRWIYLDPVNTYSRPGLARGQLVDALTVDDLDHFWFLPSRGGAHFAARNLPAGFAGHAFDGKGCAYIAMRRLGKVHGSMDPHLATGAITKVRLADGQGEPSFSHWGELKLDQPSCQLGRTVELPREHAERKAWVDRVAAVLERGEASDAPIDAATDAFVDIGGLTVDAAGNLLVIDGLPRCLKQFAADGRWLGRIDGLVIDGRQRRFADLIAVAAGAGCTYLVSTFADDRTGPALLCRVEGLPGPAPRVAWHLPVDAASRFLAVDGAVDPPLVWLGNGAGKRTLVRVTDRGTTAADRLVVGGTAEGILACPWTVATARDGRLFVHDAGRQAIVALDPHGCIQAQAQLPGNAAREFAERRRRYVETHDNESRGAESYPQSMLYDDARARLLVNYHLPVRGSELPPAAFDDALRPLPAPAEVATMRLLIGVEADGSVLAGGVHCKKRGAGAEPSVVALTDSGEAKPRVFQYRAGGSGCIDSAGNIYVVDLLGGGPTEALLDLTTTFPNATVWWSASRPADLASSFFQRGGRPITHQSEVAYVVKFPPGGGARGTPAERWAHRGAFAGATCGGGCDYHANLLACDGADRIIVGDVCHQRIKVLDTEGNLIAAWGTFGNAATLPAVGGDARDIGFRNIGSVAAAGDRIYVVDRDVRRLVGVRLGYRIQAMATGP